MSNDQIDLSSHLFKAFKSIPYQTKDFFYLYKHVSFDSEMRVLGIFDNRELKFTEPHRFNDPFDCEITFSLQHTTYRQYERFYQRAKGRMPSGRRHNLVFHTHEFFTKNKDEVLKELEWVLRPESMNRDLGVCCFNTHPTNILMWSHYAAQHQGFAVEFKIPSVSNQLSKKFDDGLYPKPVIYTKNFPIVNLNLDSLGHERSFSKSEYEELSIAVLTKASVWEYENEWRMMDQQCRRNSSGRFLKSFPPEILSSVILGLRIDPKTEEKLRKSIKKFEDTHGLTIPIYKTAKIDNQFGLTIPNHPYYG